MADDMKKAAADAAVKKPRRKGNRVAPFLILFFILAALVGIVAFNLFNLRNQYIYPALAKIPLVGGFIPNTAASPEVLDEMSSEQLTARVNELEAQLSQAQDQLKAANTAIDNDKSQIETLTVYQSQQLQFKQQKEAFDQQIAMGDPQAYVNYYQSISPDNAEKLYPQAAAAAAQSAEVKKYLADIKAMDVTNAAAMLQQMIGTDMNLVVSIMRGLDSRIAGSILSGMNPQNAAGVIKMMAPFNNTSTVYSAMSPAQVVNSLTDVPQ